MNDLFYILDASAFINGFEPKSQFNFTVSEITDEVKDLKSKILLDQAIEEGKIIIKEPKEEFIKELNEIISKSGDDLCLSEADKKLLALALDLNEENENIKVLTDDYSMQNVLKIIDIPYGSIITEGIKGISGSVDSNICYVDYPAVIRKAGMNYLSDRYLVTATKEVGVGEISRTAERLKSLGFEVKTKLL